MTDRHRSEVPPSERDGDRESRAEALLIEGLDQYLAGRYEDAIHVWTRVLFLDRSHSRARAYIGRARTALGERQRRADEALHQAEAFVAEGAVDRARALLTEAMPAATDDTRVARLWTDIDRAARARVGQTSPQTPAGPIVAVPVVGGVRGVTIMHLLTAASLGALLLTVLSSSVVRSLFGSGEPSLSVGATLRQTPLEVPFGAEVSLTRARNLYARGRLSEALAILDRVVSTGAQRAAVDALRVEIQGVLLATVTGGQATGARP